MTAEEDIIRELARGPKTLNYLADKCAPVRRTDGVKRDITGLLALMVAQGDIDVREWVLDRGKFVPVYCLKRVKG